MFLIQDHIMSFIKNCVIWTSVCLIPERMNQKSFVVTVGLKQPFDRPHPKTPALPSILSGSSAFHCHSHAHSLFIFTSALTLSLPGFNMPSFILHFSEDSIYLLYIFHWHIFQLFFTPFFFSAPLPPSLCCPSPSEAIILLPFPLYLHDTEVLSEAGADGKRQPFTKWFRFNIFPLLFITTQELHSRTNSPFVTALSFCKYHGPSLIFILLPPLSLKTPSVNQ